MLKLETEEKEVKLKTNKMKQNFYELLLDYINHFADGTEITRQELINHFHSLGMLPKYSDGRIWATTLDTYRNYLTQAGFLKIKSRGIYIKVEDISLTLRQVKKKAYGNKQ